MHPLDFRKDLNPYFLLIHISLFFILLNIDERRGPRSLDLSLRFTGRRYVLFHNAIHSLHKPTVVTEKALCVSEPQKLMLFYFNCFGIRAYIGEFKMKN